MEIDERIKEKIMEMKQGEEIAIDDIIIKIEKIYPESAIWDSRL